MDVLGVDPGGTTGACLVGYDPKTKQTHGKILDEIAESDFLKWVDSWHKPDSPWTPGIVACEDFILRPAQYQGKERIAFESQWTELPVAKQIGAIQLKCFQLGIRCIMQQPSIKPVGYANAGLNYKKGSRREGIHMQDAAAHAYYLIKNGTKQK